MKRLGQVFAEIASFENLYRAFTRARRGKQERVAIDRFAFDLEHELLRLRDDLLRGTYRPGPFFTFVIHDPKERLIAAAPFRDRLLHHAVIAVIEPWLERSLDPDSFACRRGLGLDRALERARVLSRRADWVLRSDIARCFPSIDHGVLEAILGRRFKDRRLLDLLTIIIRHGGESGRGLPIGSLTSQWFANLYLGEIDSFVRHELRPAGYLRYMDDFALLDRDRCRLRAMRSRLDGWLRENLKLCPKASATHIHSVERGWPFLGFRVYRERLEIRRESWRRLRRRMGSAYHEYRRGRRSLEDLVRSTECRLAHLERASTRGLRRKELKTAEL